MQITQHDPELLDKALEALSYCARDARDAFLLGRSAEGRECVLKAREALIVAKTQIKFMTYDHWKTTEPDTDSDRDLEAFQPDEESAEAQDEERNR